MFEIRPFPGAFINTWESSYKRFTFGLAEVLDSNKSEGNIFLTPSGRTSLNFIQYFSYLPLMCKSKNKSIKIFADSKVLALMQKIGSLPEGSYTEQDDIFKVLFENSQQIKEKNEIFEWVKAIPREAPVEMNDKLEEIFITYLGEMFNNSLDHGNASFVVGSKYYKNVKQTYTFTVYDTGVGIPTNVKTFLNKDIKDSEAIEWALQAGHSTVKSPLVPRGAGFNLLLSFAENNKGAIRICSGKGVFMYTPSLGKRFYDLEKPFVGTVFEMDIMADPNHTYILK